jgi:site-specific DNA recombinase
MKKATAAPAATMLFAIYTRESTEGQLTGKTYNSHHSQEDYLRSWVKAQGGEVFAAYSDTQSGTKLDTRPGLLRLLADAQAGRFHRAVAYDIDRWCRSIEIYSIMKRVTRDSGVLFESATQRFNDDAEGQLMEVQTAAFAQYYSQLISRKVKIKREQMLGKGMWPGGHAPFGYVSVEKKLTPEPREAETIRRMFELFLEHPSRAALRHQLRALGIKNRQGKPWSDTSLEQILRNRVYLGELRAAQCWLPGTHPPILDPALFERVQALTPTKRRIEHHMERPYPLAGVLVCASCGSQMTPHYVTKKNNLRVPYYRCTATFKQAWGACAVKQVNADKMEAWVASLLDELATSPAVSDEAVAKANASRAGDAEPLREREGALQARAREIETRTKNLVDVLARLGVSAIDAIKGQLEEAERDKVLVQAELHDLREQIRDLTRVRIDEARVREVLADVRLLYEVASGQERGELIKLMFRKIEFRGPDQPVNVELFDQERENLEPHKDGSRKSTIWLREQDSNLRPFG